MVACFCTTSQNRAVSFVALRKASSAEEERVRYSLSAELSEGVKVERGIETSWMSRICSSVNRSATCVGEVETTGRVATGLSGVGGAS